MQLERRKRPMNGASSMSAGHIREISPGVARTAEARGRSYRMRAEKFRPRLLRLVPCAPIVGIALGLVACTGKIGTLEDDSPGGGNSPPISGNQGSGNAVAGGSGSGGSTGGSFQWPT